MERISLIWAKIVDIIPNPLNPRQDYSTRTEDMQRIIKEKGWEAGITCYLRETKYIILSGHRRWFAAKQLGIQKIPVVLVSAPLSETEELERLGSVQSGKVDWSIYEWAKYTYEMWIIWGKCSFYDLSKKMGIDSTQVSVRVKVFQYYKHAEIEDKLASGVYSLFALYFLILWLNKLEKYKPELVQRYNIDLIRITLLRKIEQRLITVSDLKNELFIRMSSDEQIKMFLVNNKLSFSEVWEAVSTEKAPVNSRIKSHMERIDSALVQVKRIDTTSPDEAKDLIENLRNLRNELTNKRDELKDSFWGQ